MTRYNRTGKAPDQQLISAVAVMMWYIHIGLFPSFYLSLTALLLALMVVIFICLVCFSSFLNWTTEWIKDTSLKQERKLMFTESLKLGKKPPKSLNPASNPTPPWQLNQITKCYCISSFFEYIRGQWVHHFPGKPVPMLNQPFREEIFPIIQRELPKWWLNLATSWNLRLLITVVLSFLIQFILS